MTRQFRRCFRRKTAIIIVSCSARSTRKTGPTSRRCWPAARMVRCTKSRSPNTILPPIRPRSPARKSSSGSRTAAPGIRKRGLTNIPQLPAEQPFYRQPSTPQRTRPATVADGTMPDTVRQAILDRITNDDPDGARQLLAGIEPSLRPSALAEWRERIAWSYYIENRDADSLALAQSVSDGAGAWVAEGDWNAGLAAWRLG